jgi:hypothetical protein
MSAARASHKAQDLKRVRNAFIVIPPLVSGLFMILFQRSDGFLLQPAFAEMKPDSRFA